MSGTYNNYHLAISKDAFKAAHDAGLYDTRIAGLSMREIEPTYEAFEQRIKTYGGPWGWDRRPKYFDQRPAIEERLGADGTKLLSLLKDNKEIGYSLITEARASLSDKFFRAADGKFAEIENIALAISESGKGYGRHYLGEIFKDLFRDHDGVYLSSRSTNHSKVLSFYQKMGMTLLHTERHLPDDLVPSGPTWPEGFHPVFLEMTPMR